MSLSYETQEVGVLVGSKTAAGVRTSVALTNAYDVANKTKIIETGCKSMIDVNILYTTGAAETNNSVEMRVQVSNDRVNFYRTGIETITGGQSVMTAREFTFAGASAATAYTISIPLDVMYRYMEFSFKETGVGANAGTIFAEYTLSGK